MKLRHATAAVVSLAICGCESPGGMRSSYPATDHDPRLTQYAKSVAPIISVIEDFSERNSRLPEDTDEIIAELSDPNSAGNRWRYFADESGYQICVKLGWDPKLIYDSTDETWVFDPGDGSPTKTIELDVD